MNKSLYNLFFVSFSPPWREEEAKVCFEDGLSPFPYKEDHCWLGWFVC